MDRCDLLVCHLLLIFENLKQTKAWQLKLYRQLQFQSRLIAAYISKRTINCENIYINVTTINTSCTFSRHKMHTYVHAQNFHGIAVTISKSTSVYTCFLNVFKLYWMCILLSFEPLNYIKYQTNTFLHYFFLQFLLEYLLLHIVPRSH